MTLPFGKNCGGPLVCRQCAMIWAQIYHDAGFDDWAEIYRSKAKELVKEKLDREGEKHNDR